MPTTATTLNHGKRHTMNIESSKTFPPSEATEAMRDMYLSLGLTDAEARAILANSTTHVVIKPDHLDAGPGGARD